MPFKHLKGRKLMLCDMIYQKGSKKTDWKDYMNIIYKDLITGKKTKMTIEEPTITLYTVKPEYRTFGKPKHFLPLNQLESKEVKYRNVMYEIAKIAGDQYLEYYKTHNNFNDKKKIFKYPYCLGGDIDIETYYRTLWNEQIEDFTRKAPSIIGLDIEVDQINWDGPIPRHGECEINAVTVVDNEGKTAYTFAYDNGKNPLIKDFVENRVQEVKDKFHEMFDESYGRFEWNIYMFTDELEMIRQVFKLIHHLNKDFCMIWNMGFDIPYIIDRIEVLGGDPVDIMCANDFPTDTLYYFEDKRSFDFANKRDFFSISDYTHYTDDMINYAGLRKSQGAVKRVNLGYISQKEIKDTKLDYSDSGDIKTLPYTNYVLFILYNCKDVMLQIGIDNKVHDTETMYNVALTNCVPYKDTLKQTSVFRGLLYSYLRKKGLVLGHNTNFDVDTKGKFDENGDLIPNDDDEEDTFQGAINGDPELNLANGIMMFGNKSKYLYGLVIDFDFSAMYPISIVSFNIFATTMIGKLYILNFKLDNPYDDDLGKEYVEDVIAKNLLFLGQKWHNLSSIEDLCMKIKRRYNV